MPLKKFVGAGRGECLLSECLLYLIFFSDGGTLYSLEERDKVTTVEVVASKGKKLKATVSDKEETTPKLTSKQVGLLVKSVNVCIEHV